MKKLAAGLMMLAVVFGCGAFSFEIYYQQALPRILDTKSAYIYPKNNHGVIVYYSVTSLGFTDGFFFFGALLGLSGGLLWLQQEARDKKIL